MIPLTCTREIVNDTLSAIWESGARNSEVLILWIGKRGDGVAAVHEAYVPPQIADLDYFRLPEAEMSEIIGQLRARKLFIVAQVHSHPGPAFHSEADDRWAIVRHRGAQSIVVPRFGRGVTVENFLRQIAAYALTADDQWVAIPQHDLSNAIRF
jgi:proteasome lid subunit RPN8/RPN11